MAKRAAQSELEKEGDQKRRVATTGRLKGTSKAQFRRMAAAVDAAMVEETLQPIILLVEDLTKSNGDHEYDYQLAFYPGDRRAALHLLQRVDLTRGDEHSQLVRALYDIDEQWRCGTDEDEDAEAREKAKREAEELLMGECGLASVGRIERVYDMEEFSPFLYFQYCVCDCEEDAADDEDDDEEESGDH